MKTVAIITESQQPEITADDRRLIKPLKMAGWQAEAAPWDDRSMEWQKFDAIIFLPQYSPVFRPTRHLNLLQTRRLTPSLP